MKKLMGRWKPEDRTPLALLRSKAGFTREQAAVIMQIGGSTLANYERGLNDISFGIGEKMAELYNVSFEAIRQAVSDTKKLANESPAKNKPLKDKEIIEMALKSANNLKEVAIQ